MSDKKLLPTFLLAFLFGVFGVHRFFVGKIATGLLMLFTVGGFGIWYIIDLIIVITGSFTDKEGKRITEWT